MLYKEWLNEWLELYVKVSTSERTYKKYRRETEMYIIPSLGEYDVCELTAVELQKFLFDLTELGLSARTINFIVAMVKLSLKKSVSIGITDRQYSDAIVGPRVRAKRAASFSKDEQKKIEQYIFQKQKPMLFGILLCLYSGLRIGELLALTWEDVDLKKGTIAVTKSCHDSWEENRYVKIIDATKTQSSERVIPLPKRIVYYMKALRKLTNDKFVVTGKSNYGAEIRSYQRTFDILLKRLKIDHRGFHALRHTFATRALEIGMDIKTLSEILGHQSPAVTLQHYSHSFMEHKTEMMNKVGNLLP